MVREPLGQDTSSSSRTRCQKLPQFLEPVEGEANQALSDFFLGIQGGGFLVLDEHKLIAIGRQAPTTPHHVGRFDDRPWLFHLESIILGADLDLVELCPLEKEQMSAIA